MGPTAANTPSPLLRRCSCAVATWPASSTAERASKAPIGFPVQRRMALAITTETNEWDESPVHARVAPATSPARSAVEMAVTTAGGASCPRRSESKLRTMSASASTDNAMST